MVLGLGSVLSHFSITILARHEAFTYPFLLLMKIGHFENALNICECGFSFDEAEGTESAVDDWLGVCWATSCCSGKFTSKKMTLNHDMFLCNQPVLLNDRRLCEVE